MATRASLLIGVLLLLSCGGETGAFQAPFDWTVAIEGSPDTVLVTTRTSLHAIVRDAAGNVNPTAPLAWSSSDTGIASVDPSGVLTAHATGHIWVFARALAFGDSTGITVEPFVSGLSIASHADSLLAHEFLRLQATVLDGAGATDSITPVQWSTSDRSIILVGPSGTIEGVAPGAAWVVARAARFVDSTRIRVLPLVARILITPADTFGPPGAPVRLTATLLDSSGAVIRGRPIAWSSTDTSLVTVDSAGTATPLALTAGEIVVRSSGYQQSATVRGAASFRWIIGGVDGECVGIDGPRTYCNGFARWGAGQPCSDLQCPALQAMPAAWGPIDTIATSWWTGGACGLRDGAAICWGQDPFGLFFTGATTAFVPPHSLSGLPPLRSISVARYHACGLSDHTVWCWGHGVNGAVGDSSSACLLELNCGPFALAGISATAVAVDDEQRSCALSVDGSVACWGVLQDNASNPTPVAFHPVVIDGIPAATAIAMGDRSACILAVGGATWCWGSNTLGQLGDGTFLDRSVPAKVAGIPALQVLTSSNVGYCGLDMDGAAWCWGYAAPSGQPGSLSNVSACGLSDLCRPTPVHLGGDLRFKTLSVGRDESCGLTIDDVAYCWGREPALGHDRASYTDIPYRVEGQAP